MTTAKPKQEDIYEIEIQGKKATVIATWLPLNDTMKFIVDDSYQRGLNESRARRYAVAWSPALAGLVALSYRKKENVYAICDGQHRIRGATIRGHDEIWAEVFYDLNVTQEAWLYRERNRKRVATSSIDDFRAGFRAGDPQVVRITRIIHELGCDIRPASSDPKSYAAVSALILLDDWDVLKPAIELSRSAWGDNTKVKERTVVLASGMVIWNHRHINLIRWERKMAEAPLVAWISEAASLHATLGHRDWEHLARTMVHHYNKGLSGGERLDENLRVPPRGSRSTQSNATKG
jgi:hypothetical protein